MKASPKEKLYDKSRKMIDLAYDEVREGGEKEISAAFTDPKTKLVHQLTVKLNIHTLQHEVAADDPDYVGYPYHDVEIGDDGDL